MSTGSESGNATSKAEPLAPMLRRISRSKLVKFGVGAVAIWVALLAVFFKGRLCEPIFSSRCVTRAWDYVGDAVWLVELRNWQDMAGGALALAAAFIGGWYLTLQMRQAEAHEKERRRRAFASARTMMVITLSMVCDYLEDCAGVLVTHHDIRSEKTEAELPKRVSLPIAELASIQKMIEGADENIATPFESLTRQIQLLDARIRYLTMRHGAREIEDRMIDVARTFSIAVALFPFCRKEAEELPSPAIIGSQISTALGIVGLDYNRFPNLIQLSAAEVLRWNAESKWP